MTVTSISSPSARIAAEIRAEAARQGVSLREIARRLGVSQPWVTRRVSVHADVDLKVTEIDQIAETLGTTAAELIAASGWLRVGTRTDLADAA